MIRLKVKFQAPAYCPRRGILNGNFLALFCDLVDIIRHIGDVKFNIQSHWLRVPQCHSRRQIGGEMIGEPVAALHDGGAAITKRAAPPKNAPATVVEHLRRSRGGLVKGWDNSLRSR